MDLESHSKKITNRHLRAGLPVLQYLFYINLIRPNKTINQKKKTGWQEEGMQSILLLLLLLIGDKKSPTERRKKEWKKERKTGWQEEGKKERKKQIEKV